MTLALPCEFRLADHETRMVRYQLFFWSIVLLMLVSLFVGAISALTEPQPPNNRIFGVIAGSFVAFLIVMSARLWLLFAVYVRIARLEGNVISISRFLTPVVRIPMGRGLPRKAHAMPSFGPPGYERGTLFMAGTSSFYLPDSFPAAGELTSRVRGPNET